MSLRELYAAAFGCAEGACVEVSAPGRVELAGNHTDHQGGRVISGAASVRMHALAARNDSMLACVDAGAFGRVEIDLAQEEWHVPREDERGTSAALVRGMLVEFALAHGMPCGFNAVVTSDIPAGCGLASSAAFEVLTGMCVEAFATGARTPHDAVGLALAGMRVEDAYYGKPSGAQDQLASACGGALFMDFAPERPDVRSLPFDSQAAGFRMCLIDSGAHHAHGIDEFNAVPADMRDVACFFGETRLADVDAADFFACFSAVRAQLGDRAALRALHFFDETSRVEAQRKALEAGDFEAFLAGVRSSGASSAQFLQNVVSRSAPENGQDALAVLGLCAHYLGERGAYRIHGGGFGGCVIAFVPLDEALDFKRYADDALGFEACRFVQIDAAGACAREVRA